MTERKYLTLLRFPHTRHLLYIQNGLYSLSVLGLQPSSSIVFAIT